MQQLSSFKPLLSRELVGRACELKHLGEALHRATAGCPQFVLLSGKSGVGKTRLCRAFLDQSREQHPLFFWGRALPQDQAVPFGPFLDAFRRSFDSSASPLLLPDQSLVPSFAFLVHLLPELAGRFPEFATSLQDDLPVPARRQPVLFHDMLLGLQALIELHPPPLLLMLEDLHWADETSLEFLMYLAQRLDVNSTSAERSTPLLILGTYRSEAIAESTDLQRMLWHLQAQRHLTELHLAPLTLLDHRRCVSSILDQTVPEEFADFLFTWDEGNPFFAEEFLETMAATGQLQVKPHGQGWSFPQQDRPPLPSSITATILERFLRLPPLDQEVLTMASVIGRTFDFSLLAEVCNLDEHALAAVLSRAISRQFLSEVTSTTSWGFVEPLSVQYHFRHALIRQTIYDRMHTVESLLRHRTIAEAIERLHTHPSTSGSARLPSLDRVASLLVMHYRLAGLLDQARPYALQAAQQASMLGAYQEERFYLEVAQEGLPEECPERLQLLERMGIASIGMFDFPAALHWLSLVREGYLRREQCSHALEALATMLLPAWFLADSTLPQVLSELERGVEAAFVQTDPTKRDVHVLMASAQLTIYQGICARYQRICQLVERNKALCATLTDPQKVVPFQISTIAHAWARANQHITFLEESILEIKNALIFAHQQSLPHVLMFAYGTLLLILIGLGRIDEAEQFMKEAIAFEVLSDLMRLSCYPVYWLSFFSGKGWAQELELMSDSREHMRQNKALGVLAIDELVSAHFLIARGELQEAQTCLTHAQPLLERMNEALFLLWMGWGFAKLSMAQGNHEQAQAWYEDTLEYWRTTEDTLFILPILLDGLTFYTQIGNLQQASAWLAHLQQVTSSTDNPVGKAALLEAQGIIAAQQKKLQPALEALRQAVQAWGALKFRYRQAVAAHHLAELLLQQGGGKTTDHKTRQHLREEAEGLLQHAAHIYEQLGIAGQAQAVQQLRAESRLDAQRKRRRTLAIQRQAGGLTPRELQILQLLAAGKTNNEIARTLGISLSTVELHVTHILTKLNCENRTQAVVHAVSKGWITTSS